MEKVLLLLEKQGRSRGDLERNLHELGLSKAHPALAYFALDCRRYHSLSTVDRWLRAGLPTALGQGPAARIKYLAGLRRRSLKSRPEWVERRFEWTNQINRSCQQAKKLLNASSG